jgi:hypothetical protein
MTADPVIDLRAAHELVRRWPPLPDAYLHDATRLAFLEAVTRAAGRDPFPSGTVDRLTGIPIFLDPDVEPDVLEFRWPDGRIERIRLAGDLYDEIRVPFPPVDFLEDRPRLLGDLGS